MTAAPTTSTPPTASHEGTSHDGTSHDGIVADRPARRRRRAAWMLPLLLIVAIGLLVAALRATSGVDHDDATIPGEPPSLQAGRAPSPPRAGDRRVLRVSWADDGGWTKAA